MAGVCVGCGLKVTSGLLELDAEPLHAYQPRGSLTAAVQAELDAIAPNASVGSLDNFGVWETELAVLELENTTCRTLRCIIQARGRTRIDTLYFSETLSVDNNEVRNEIRINSSVSGAGAWIITDLSSYGQIGDDSSSKEWNDVRVVPSITIAPGEVFTFDRRAVFRWESHNITWAAAWVLPAIDVVAI